MQYPILLCSVDIFMLNCGGSGKIITEHCTECHGSGKAQVEHSIKVDIPGGIADGSTIRVRGGGSVDKQR